jgi:hypothetical protein
MALSTCRDCNREVSTRARHCVHCGRPSPTGQGAGSLIAGIATVILALVLTAGVVCAAKRACKQISKRGCPTERISSRLWECSDGQPREVDKAAFIRTLEKDGAKLTEVRPNLYKLTPAVEIKPEETR